jgi:hypothetical protein
VKVATAIGNKKLCFADPQAGQIGYRGIVEENVRKQIVMTRIKVEDQKISEIEALVLRGGSFNNPDGLDDHPIFLEPLPSGDRPSRDELISIANSYFEGLEKKTGDITPFDPGCTRLENGTITANNPNPTIFPFHKQTCGEQFKIPGFPRSSPESGRTFLIVDEDRGLVRDSLFDHAVCPVKLPDGRFERRPFNAPTVSWARRLKSKISKSAGLKYIIEVRMECLPDGANVVSNDRPATPVLEEVVLFPLKQKPCPVTHFQLGTWVQSSRLRA